MQQLPEGLKVLTTRPENLASPLVEPLIQAGAEVENIPLLDIEPLELPPQQRQALIDLDHYQKVVVISPTAADQLLQRLDDYWPQWPVGVDWFSVGAGTARKLEDQGLSVNYPARGDKSEDLLQLPELQELSGQKLLLVKGQGGRKLLHDTLVSRGASIQTLELYSRIKPRLSQKQIQGLKSQAWQVIVISSGEALQQYIEFTDGSNHHLHLLLPSERLVTQAREAGFAQVINSQGAGPQAVLEALIKHFPGGS
ncbi:uroporphyrinogen-III synthase [Marinospirillum sp.]|uniref:uroporphyrinogen-III synthase n=1 Tax=Marinospirillum sp. TaxID=2183934 RepID=UPI00384B417A